jgi:hypothetical protein
LAGQITTELQSELQEEGGCTGKDDSMGSEIFGDVCWIRKPIARPFSFNSCLVKKKTKTRNRVMIRHRRAAVRQRRLVTWTDYGKGTETSSLQIILYFFFFTERWHDRRVARRLYVLSACV